MTELRSFLGLANYYRRFIKGYSKLACPPRDLLKKERKWEWDAECQVVFQKLKDAITLEPVLRLLDLELPFEVHTDVSNRAQRGGVAAAGARGAPNSIQESEVGCSGAKVHHP